MRAISIFAAILCIWDFVTAQVNAPVLCFSDLTSGPKSGNTDVSLGQTSGQDGAIVTIWGKRLGGTQGTSKIFLGGIESKVYSWGNATAPADLFTRHGMQMIGFQVSHLAANGQDSMYVTVGGIQSNKLPFIVRTGNIYFVKKNGNNTAAGTWTQPWGTIPGAVNGMSPGDITYVCDSVSQTTLDNYSATVNLGQNGQNGNPLALVVYPGATVNVGSDAIERGFHNWVSGYAEYWVISKFKVRAHTIAIPIRTGYRVVGNYVTCPTGSAPEGGIEGSGNNFFVLGNEITQVGKVGASKLYHPMYISSERSSSGARNPAEGNREIAWNYLHDNNAIRGINIYSEQTSTAFMSGHKVHDNFIIDQVSDGMLLGYYMTGENWIYNNVIIKAGLGPDPDPAESEASSHYGVQIDAGHESIPATGTTIYFYNNTIYGCGWGQGANGPGASGSVCITNLSRYTLKFCNNIIVSTGEPYIAGWSDQTIAKRDGHNLWFGKTSAPSWDTTAITGDPKFIDTASANMRLMAGSPAINAGINTGLLMDFDAVPRPQSTAYDLGAYEFADGASVGYRFSQNHSAHGFSNQKFISVKEFNQQVTSADATGYQLFDLSGKSIIQLMNPVDNSKELPAGLYLRKSVHIKR